MNPELSRRQKFAMFVMITGQVTLGRLVAWLMGPELCTADLMKEMYRRLPIDQLKQEAIARGNARSVQEWEQLSAKAAAGLNPDSHWTFHREQWGPHQVVVMPRIIDSNTAVVTGPPENPERGSVITNDGLPPNCDPPALNQILYGDQVPNV